MILIRQAHWAGDGLAWLSCQKHSVVLLCNDNKMEKGIAWAPLIIKRRGVSRAVILDLWVMNSLGLHMSYAAYQLFHYTLLLVARKQASIGSLFHPLHIDQSL